LPARAPANRTRRAANKPNRSEENDRPVNDAPRDPNTQTFRTSGTVKTVLRDAKFLVETEQGLEVVARAAGRMRRGRKIRILAGDAVDLEVSLYDPTRGRIIWRHV
jgi:translation initiation factor IF-1